jgi:hypothetical protein
MKLLLLPALTLILLVQPACQVAAQVFASQSIGSDPAFQPLFNGKDLAGWRGGDTFDPRRLAAMTPAQRNEQIAQWTQTMRAHWRAENGELVNDGQGAYATTEKDYGDIELHLDYRTVPLADSGIYLRGCPQVQIWDHTNQREFRNGANKGSGGLWNNSAGAPGKDPLVLADKPFGEWNHFRVRQLGSRTSVWLNEKLVVENAIMENYFNRKQPIPPRGPIQLQTHGGEIRWRNILVREIPTEEANQLLRGTDPSGFKPIFNGKDFEGWAGPLDAFEIKDGALACKAGRKETIYTQEEYSDFVVRFEFRLPKGGNNGLAIRYPGQGDTAYDGMCELQVLDDLYLPPPGEKFDPRQAHGSAYGMVAAARGYHRRVGEWNFQEVTVIGSKIKVELNGTIILDTDLSQVKETLENKPHPGKDRTRGHFGFAGHNDPVMFRNISIKTLQ